MIDTLHALRYIGVGKGTVAANERKEKAMTESNEVRASHEEVEAFVGKLREFHSSLGESEQTMLGGRSSKERSRARRAGTGG